MVKKLHNYKKGKTLAPSNFWLGCPQPSNVRMPHRLLRDTTYQIAISHTFGLALRKRHMQATMVTFVFFFTIVGKKRRELMSNLKTFLKNRGKV